MIGAITGKNLNVIRFLSIIIFPGKLEPVHTFIKYTLGTFLHFLTGVIYAFTYYGLWTTGIGKPNFFYSIVFGVASGLIAVSVWKLLIRKNLERINVPNKTFYTGLFFTHIIFSMVVFYTYLFLARYPLPMDQSINCC